jgi:hypothetical protein
MSARLEFNPIKHAPLAFPRFTGHGLMEAAGAVDAYMVMSIYFPRAVFA